MSFRRLIALVAFVLVLPALTALAGPARLFDSNLRRVLKSAPPKGKVVLRDVSLREDRLDTIELESFEVWASDAKIRVYGASGEPSIMAPPDVDYFKGQVVGEPASAVFFSMSRDGSIRGLIIIGDQRWNVGSGVPKSDDWRDRVKTNATAEQAEHPILISQIDELDELNDQSGDWSCDTRTDAEIVANNIRGLSSKALKPKDDAGNVAGATYQIRLAFETDNEFCAGFSNNSGTITTYIGDLVGKANIVYERDLATTLVTGDVNIRNGGAGTDPWVTTTGGGTSPALAEFGTFWHNNFSLGYPDPDGGGTGTAGGGTTVARSSAVFLSGRLFSGGVAWFDVLCGNNIFCGTTGANCGSSAFANAYAGSYAFNGSSGSVTTTVPDPEATVNGILYGLPTGNSFWMLLEVLHELGHNVGGPHTQCVALSAQEKIDYGVTRDFVDECANFDGAPCFSASTSGGQACSGGYCPGGVPAEKGTVMSYCHNIFVSSFRQSRYTFGTAGDPSEKVLALFKDALELATPNPTITAQAEPVACSSGRTASVATCTGCTYAWQITGGSITSSTTTNSITYTPTGSSVTLTVTIITSKGCGITASKTIATSCVAVQPPTGVTATATDSSTVNVTWNAAAGAASYNVYRSILGSSFTLAGSTSGTTFNDTGRTAGTAHLYMVRSVSGGESSNSNIDLATTIIFNDIFAGLTTVDAFDVEQLRTAVDAVRTLASLSAGSYTDTLTPELTNIRAVHITDLRTALDTARVALNLSAISYGETPTATVTSIKKSHIIELRDGVN